MDVLALKTILNRLDDIDRAIQGNRASPWLTTREVAEFLRCSISKIEKLTHVGLLPFHRLDPNSPKSIRLYHRRDLTTYLVTGKNGRENRLSAAEKREVDRLS